MKDINTETFELSAKNPNKKVEVAMKNPKEILEEILKLDKKSKKILDSIKELL